MLRAIDALEINFVDSAARSEFKLNTSTERGGGKSNGIGEKRLYITNTKDPKELDDFFEFNITKYFFFKKFGKWKTQNYYNFRTKIKNKKKE